MITQRIRRTLASKDQDSKNGKHDGSESEWERLDEKNGEKGLPEDDNEERV